jgi:hypothetical protein
MCISTRPLTQRSVRSSTWSASLSVGERRCVFERSSSWCQGPMSSTSRTMTQPVRVPHVVSRTIVPGR